MLTAHELLSLISKQWATVDDIMKIGCVGKNKAQQIKKNIIEDTGKKFPHGLVDMKLVVKYFDIDISYLKKVEKKDS